MNNFLSYYFFVTILLVHYYYLLCLLCYQVTYKVFLLCFFGYGLFFYNSFMKFLSEINRLSLYLCWELFINSFYFFFKIWLIWFKNYFFIQLIRYFLISLYFKMSKQFIYPFYTFFFFSNFHFIYLLNFKKICL